MAVTSGNVVNGDLNAVFSPAGYGDLAPLVAPDTIIAVNAVQIFGPPTGWLQIFDGEPVEGVSASSYSIPLVKLCQVVDFAQLSAFPLDTLAGGHFWYGWSFDPYTFFSMLAKRPNATLAMLFGVITQL